MNYDLTLVSLYNSTGIENIKQEGTSSSDSFGCRLVNTLLITVLLYKWCLKKLIIYFRSRNLFTTTNMIDKFKHLLNSIHINKHTKKKILCLIFSSYELPDSIIVILCILSHSRTWNFVISYGKF